MLNISHVHTFRNSTDQDAGGYGLQLMADNADDLRVARILPGGRAAVDGRLRVGDTIIAINGVGVVRGVAPKAKNEIECGGSCLTS